MKAKRLLFVMAMAGLLLAGTASASSITAHFDGLGQSVGVNVHYTDSGGGGHDEGTYAGVYVWTVTGGDFMPIHSELGAFCFDVASSISIGGTYSWSVQPLGAGFAPIPTPPGGALKQQQVDDLKKLYGYFYKPDTWSDLEAAAFGASVWEIVWESPASGLPSTYDVDADLLRVTGNGVEVRAQEMLDLVKNPIYAGTYSGQLYALYDQTAQDQLVGFGTGRQEPPVPESLTMLSVVAGVGGLGMYLRKRGQD